VRILYERGIFGTIGYMNLLEWHPTEVSLYLISTLHDEVGVGGGVRFGIVEHIEGKGEVFSCFYTGEVWSRHLLSIKE